VEAFCTLVVGRLDVALEEHFERGGAALFLLLFWYNKTFASKVVVFPFFLGDKLVFTERFTGLLQRPLIGSDSAGNTIRNNIRIVLMLLIMDWYSSDKMASFHLHYYLVDYLGGNVAFGAWPSHFDRRADEGSPTSDRRYFQHNR
jgi:hypothetical protein